MGDVMTKQTTVVIFNSPLYHDHYEDDENYLPPLGLGYIVSELKRNGICANLVDCVYERLSVEEIINYINLGSFQNVGFNIFSVNMTLLEEIVCNITRPINIYWGGKAIAYLWQSIIRWKCTFPMTFIIGEGELILPALINNRCRENSIFSDVRNKVYLVDKYSIYYPTNLDKIALDRTIFKNREITNLFGQLESCLVASRGCIFDCAFCGGSKTTNPNITPRMRSIKSLDSEICEIMRLCPKVQSVRILDDLFLRDRKSISQACQLFNKYPSLNWRCMVHVTSFINNFDLIPVLRHSGCTEVFIGIESGSDFIRHTIKKVGSVKNVESTVHELLCNGINVKGYFICGFPEETEEQIICTYDLATRLWEFSLNTPGKFRASAFKFRPYHGTELYRRLFPEGENCQYEITNNLVSAHHQYNFSAGNFSSVANDTLDDYLMKINSLEHHV